MHRIQIHTPSALLLLFALQPAHLCGALSIERDRPQLLSSDLGNDAAAARGLLEAQANASYQDTAGHALATASAGARSRSFGEAVKAFIFGSIDRSAAGSAVAARAHNDARTITGRGNMMANVGVWICVAAVIAVMVFSAYVLMWYVHITGGESKKVETQAISARSFGRKAPAPAVMRPRSSRTSNVGKPPSSWSSFYTESINYEAVSVRSSSMGLTSQGNLDGSRRTSAVPLLPLCPQLIVPDGTRLKCVLQEAVCRRKQDLIFNISGIAAHGGAPLFQIRVVERTAVAGACGIFVETLGGKEQFAFLSTQELWANEEDPSPNFHIMRPGGLPYAVMQKNPQGEYVVRSGQESIMTFSGDLQTHDIQIRGSLGQTVGLVGNSNGGEYEVQVNPRSDAGLVVLGLLSIDKFERRPTSPPGSGIGRNTAPPTDRSVLEPDLAAS